MYDFEKFPVYISSLEFQELVMPLISDKRIPKNLVDQLDRASTSITLNIAEGTGKYSSKDKKNFYITARGSTQECVAILQVFLVRNLVAQQSYDLLYEKLTSISKILSGLINKMIEMSKSSKRNFGKTMFSK